MSLFSSIQMENILERILALASESVITLLLFYHSYIW